MLLEKKTFIVKEHVAMLKLTDTYDILDPETQQQIGVAKEEPGDVIKYARLIISKKLLPTTVNIYEQENKPPVLSIHKPLTFMQAKVIVTGETGESLGYFKSKLFSLGGGFWVYDQAERQVAEVKGDWKGWNFTFVDQGGNELGTITKKWGGLGKELFTSADTYAISLGSSVTDPRISGLLLAAGIAVDIVYKEGE